MGAALVERTIAEAVALNVPTLHLWTSGQGSYYQRLGWAELRQFTQAGSPACIMTYRLV